jgi:hypothetical protein
MKKMFFFIFILNINFCKAQRSDSTFTILQFQKNIKINIIGDWKDQNSTISYFKNGAYLTQYDNGHREIGKWKLKAKQLILSANGTSVDEVYDILYFYQDTMKTQLANGSDTTIWTATKIK